MALPDPTHPSDEPERHVTHEAGAVAVVMGSDSDWPTMQGAVDILAEFGVPTEVRVLSAHRRPHEMLEYGQQAAPRGILAIIAGAGGAAHLPGMLASVTTLPVIGVPVPLARLDGLDSLFSIVQMPTGVPVATVAIGNATNAGLLAVRMLSISRPELTEALGGYQMAIAARSREADRSLQDRLASEPPASSG